MATIKELIQNFCYRVNIPAPSSIVGVSSPNERQLLSLFQYIGDNLRNRPFNWPQLKRSYTFTTETNVRKYQLPGDFYRLLESTQWDITNQWPMRGPISDYNFTVREYAVVSLQTRKAYRLIGATQYLFATSPYSQRSAGYIEIDPAGENNTDELLLQYISANWIWPRDWVTATAYTAGDLRSCDGYVGRAGSTNTSGATRPTLADNSDGTITWADYREPYLCAPSNTALNDSDLVLFDEDLMIEGMRWAYKRQKGMDYQQERADWEAMIRGAFARFNGPIRVNMGDEFGDYPGDWPNVPAGSWSV